jgi:hypothetical protein
MIRHKLSLCLCVALFAGSGCEQKPAEVEQDQQDSNAPATPKQDLVTTANPSAPTPPAAEAPPSVPSAPAPSAPSPASEAQIAELSKPSGGANGGMYTVHDGTKVDPNTLKGWKTWRALACDRCHGAEQQGMVGPALTVSLHRLTKEQFKKTLTDGRPEKGMPPFSASPMVMENIENLYAYLKGRADAQIKPGHLYPIENSNL